MKRRAVGRGPGALGRTVPESLRRGVPAPLRRRTAGPQVRVYDGRGHAVTVDPSSSQGRALVAAAEELLGAVPRRT